MGLTEGFFIFLVTSVITCSLAVCRMLYKSKCRTIDCCGIKIVRDVRAEEHLDGTRGVRVEMGNSNESMI